MAGRKVRCGNCNQVVRVPEAPAAASELDLLDVPPAEAMMAAPSPMEMPANMLSMEEDPSAASPIPEDDLPDFDDSDDSSDDDEVAVKEAAAARCKVCGTEGTPGDTVCLACGAEIEQGRGGAFNKLLAKFPKKARIGVGIGLGVLLLIWVVVAIWRAGRDGSFVAEGQTQIDLEDFNTALKSFRTALEWNPKNLSAIEGAIKCCLKTGKKTEVPKYAQRLANVTGRRNQDPYDKTKAGEIYFVLAKYYKEQVIDKNSTSEKSSALVYVNKAKVLAGGSIEGIQELFGHIYFRSGDWPQARNFYKEAVKAETEDPLVYLNLARIARKEGKIEAARKYIAKAQTTNPAEANVELARIKESGKKWSEALGHWKQAVQAKGNLHSARIGYGRALLREGKIKDAFEQASEAKKLVQENDSEAVKETLALNCEVLFRLKRYDKALIEAESLLAVDKKSVVGQFYKGAILFQQGLNAKDSKKAREGELLMTRTVQVRQNPADYVAAAKILGSVKSKRSAALQLLDSALKVDSKYAEAHLLHVMLREKTNNPQLLKKAIENALKALPKNIDLNVRLSGIYWDQKKETLALDLLRKLKRQNPDTERVLLILANRLYERGREERDPPLPDEEREPLLKEALKIFLDAKKRLKSSEATLPNNIKAVKTELLPFS
jgi:tetratricopeptide (TPR) repeat protein